MKIHSIIELILLAAIWGASFIFMRIASPELGPIFFMAMRTCIASLFLIPLMFLYKQHRELRGYEKKMFIAGMLNTAIPFVLFGYAALHLSAGMASILNATTPMFGAIVAYIWLKDKLSLGAIAGLIVGFIGVYLLMFEKVAIGQSNVILPSLAIMLATLCYGIGANYTKRYLSKIKPLALATGSQFMSALVLLLISIPFIPESLPSLPAIYSTLFLGIVCTGIAYIIFFHLLTECGPTKAMSVTYLIPVFGLFFGAVFLNELITGWILIGASLILFGVGLTTDVLGKKTFNTLKYSFIKKRI